MFYVWFIIALVLGVIEAITTNLVSVWFVISALLSMIISMFTDNLSLQIGLFVLVGVLLMPISKKLYKKIKTIQPVRGEKPQGRPVFVIEEVLPAFFCGI